VTVEEVQALFDAQGGSCERRAPVAWLMYSGPNVGYAFDEEGGILGSWAWRPWSGELAGTDHLFIC
jgi:hypothetical protein